MTGYFDLNMDRQFGVCTKMRTDDEKLMNLPLSEELWAPGQPDNVKGQEPCVVLNLSNSTGAGYYDAPCNEKMLVLCKVVLLIN